MMGDMADNFDAYCWNDEEDDLSSEFIEQNLGENCKGKATTMNKPSQERIERAAKAIQDSLPEAEKPYSLWYDWKPQAEAALTADDSHLAAENAELRAEIDEQCRIIGMSGETEARHLTEIEQLRKLLGEAEELLPFMAESKLESAITLLTKIRAEREVEE